MPAVPVLPAQVIKQIAGPFVAHVCFFRQTAPYVTADAQSAALSQVHFHKIQSISSPSHRQNGLLKCTLKQVFPSCTCLPSLQHFFYMSFTFSLLPFAHA